MKESPVLTVKIFAAALMATVFSLPAFAAGSAEDLKQASPVPAAEQAAAEKAVRPGRTAFDEFSVIGDPLYRQGSMELLKKAVKEDKEGEKAKAAEKALPAGGKSPGPAAAPAVKKPRPSGSRPSDLRDAPSGVIKSLPAPRIKAPAPKAVPADPVAPRKAS